MILKKIGKSLHDNLWIYIFLSEGGDDGEQPQDVEGEDAS
jgi:hypothetical protein